MVRIDSKRLAWAFFWLSIGAGAVITVIGLPRQGVVGLLAIAGIGFSFSAHYFKRLTVWAFLLIWGALSLLGYEKWPSPNDRHVSKEQKKGLANLRDELPKQCGMLIYVPDDSMESQRYGKEIQGGLQLHGARANIIHEGVMPAPVGLIVGVRSSLEPCGEAGEMLSVGMTIMHMPTRLQETFPRADETTVILFVGTKPPYD